MGYLRHLTLSAILLLLFPVLGCDPGYSYKPIDKSGTPMPEWSASVEGVDFGFSPLHGLVGSRYISYGPEISNQSAKTVILLDGRLTTNGRTIKATLPGSGESEWRTVLPGEVKTVSLLWDRTQHGSSKELILGQKISWSWRVRIGKKKHSFEFDTDRGP